jgi:hypothetical protein
MANNIVGLDVAQMNALADRFGKASELVGNAERNIARAVNAAWWVGPTANQFRASWTSVLSPQLRQASTNLTNQRLALTRQVREQIATSADGITISPIGPIANDTAPKVTPPPQPSPPVGFDTIDGLVSTYGWLSIAKDLQETIPLVMFMTKAGLGFGASFATSLNAGLNMSKIASSGFSAWTGVSLAIGAIDLWSNVSQTGWTSGQTYKSIVGTVGTVAATYVAGPIGGVVFDLTSKGTAFVVNKIDEKYDTSGAFVASVTARTGKVPDYSGASGLPRYMADGFLNVFSPKAWGFR